MARQARLERLDFLARLAQRRQRDTGFSRQVAGDGWHQPLETFLELAGLDRWSW